MEDVLWIARLVEERAHRDDEGRPIREGRTPPEHLKPDDIEWKDCNYPGSRFQTLPMNMSALRQMSAHWDEMVGALGFLRAAYTRARGGYATDLLDIWRVSQLGSGLPWYFVLSGRTSPAYAAALSKATLGVGIWGAKLIVKSREGWVPPQPFTSKQMLELAEQTGTLLAETEVCSGPEKMLLAFFDVLTEDTYPSESSLAAEGDQAWAFGSHYLAYKQMLWVYCLMKRFLLHDCRAVLGERDDVKALLAAPCEPLDFYTLEPPSPAAVPLPVRAMWFRTLVDTIVSLAPDGSEGALRGVGHRMANVMGDAPAGADVIARACAQFAQLDVLLGEALTIAEAALRRTTGAPAAAATIDAASRDRVQVTPVRAFFTSLGQK
ncbi:MAG TPA: hypothetical protein VIV11_07595 [Kofleriaceae bacterium]